MIQYENQILDIVEAARLHVSTISPSDWTEQNVIMQKPFPGPFRYNKTPYTKEIVNCFAPDHPCRVCAVMKGAQIGFSAGVIYPGIAWMIKNNPGNTKLMLGAPDLIEKSMAKIDLIIDNAGLRNMIKAQAQRKKAGKTGDTDLKKEFPQGYLSLASANNHKAIRQEDLQFLIVDDYEAIKGSSKESGSTLKLMEQRLASYADKSKLFLISTPELRATSNIEPAYLLGDQRKFLIPCPCCGTAIEIKWSIALESGDTAGMTWKTDERGRLISGSVGYLCQSCGGFFNDSKKDDLLNMGYWSPTAEPSREGYFSYHISSLYAPAGMFDWQHYVANYLDACPENEKRKEDLYQSHVNLCLGETYEGDYEEPDANQLQKNIRNYPIGTIPETMSIADGNGRIVMLTCASDLNGTIDDARLDYEIVGWSETGASYSITHGSIGTFIPREGTAKAKEDRERWTYQHNQAKSVWPEFEKIIKTVFTTDTGRRIPVLISGVDTGHYTLQAYSYIDSSNAHVVGLKGDKEDKYQRYGIDLPTYKNARERANLFIVQVGQLKDSLSDMMRLKYNENQDPQPAGFMNFPMPSDGQYYFKTYFEHYAAEHRVLVPGKEGAASSFRWVKKLSTSQNHFWDVRIYNMVLKDILMNKVFKELKTTGTWVDFCALMLGQKNN